MNRKPPADFPAVLQYVLPSQDCHYCVEAEVIDDPDYTFYDMHYEFEVGVVLTGAMTRTYQDGSLDLGPGEVWMTGMWEPHGMRVRQVPCTLVIAYVRPDALTLVDLGERVALDWAAPFYEFPIRRPRIIDPAQKAAVAALAQRLAAGTRQTGSQRTTIEMLSVLELLALVQENWKPSEVDPAALRVRHTSITPAMELLFRRKSGASTEEAAEACAMGAKTFARLFFDLMGTSFADYARDFRLRGAAKDLVHGRLPIKEVVETWGFSDESYFTKAFFRHFGCTPSAYRAKA